MAGIFYFCNIIFYMTGKLYIILLLIILPIISPAQDKYITSFLAPDHVIFNKNVKVSVRLKDLNGEVPVKDTVLILTVNGKQNKVNITQGTGEIIISELETDNIYIFDRDDKLLFKKEIRRLPAFLSVLPPIITIALAIAFQEVIVALVLGIIFGIILILGIYDPVNILKGPIVFISDFLLRVLTDKDKIPVIVFSLLIGGMVSLLMRNGSMSHLIRKVSSSIKSRAKVMFSVWIMGILIFFDDYANTLIVGNSMRPLADRFKVSREKLAYIVDSTAAPVASVAFITTWIGAQLGFIDTALEQLPIQYGAYNIFLQSLPYSFYPFFTLFFIVILILKKRDFGPMYRAEKKAIRDFNKSLKVHHQAGRAENMRKTVGRSKGYEAVITVFVLVLVALITLFNNSMTAEIWDKQGLNTRMKLMEIISHGDSNKALLLASFSALTVAFVFTLLRRNSLGLKRAVETIVDGFRTMLIAMIILVLAWTLAEVTSELNTAGYMSELISGNISPVLLPAIIFVLSAIIAFSVGSSWGTMAVLYPFILPATFQACMDSGMQTAEMLPIFYMAVSAVLGGSVLGDHCSPISDTTILSSMASQCDHIRHVKTQLPYSLTVGLVSILAGYLLSSAFRISPFISMVIGFLIIYLSILLLGKKISYHDHRRSTTTG